MKPPLISFYILLLALISVSNAEETNPSRPAGVGPSDWIALGPNVGLVILETQEHEITSSNKKMEKYHEDELKKLSADPNKKQAAELLKARLEQLRKDQRETPGIADACLMVQKDGRWFVVRINGLETTNWFHYLQKR